MGLNATPAAGAAAPAAPVLQLRGITKRFGALVANDGISLQLDRGEVLALLGENGAGKSTLVSILFGHYTADEGHITVDGQPLPPGNPKAALAAGIGMVHQHFTLADNLSVLDNVLLGTEALWQPFSHRRAAAPRCWTPPGASAWRWTRTRAWPRCRWASASAWRSSRHCCPSAASAARAS